MNAPCNGIGKLPQPAWPHGLEPTNRTQSMNQKRDTAMRSLGIFAATAALLVSAPAIADDVKVGIGISGWTGFAPLTLANQTGIFKKNGLDVTIKKIPQKDRHLAIASGDVQCAATTVETWISWNANGVATKQIFQLDKSYGADGMATRNDVASIKDLKGKTIAASAPGTAPYFTLAWMLKKNGLSVKDVTVVNLEPAATAQAFVSGQNDAAMTYQPYLSPARAAEVEGLTWCNVNNRCRGSGDGLEPDNLRG